MSTLIGSMLDILIRRIDKCGIFGATKIDRRRYGLTTRNMLVDAHRFHLSSRTAMIAAKLGFEANDKNMLLSLARPPFDDMWLEWNIKDQLEGVNITPSVDPSERVGVLIRKVSITQFMITSVMTVGKLAATEVFVSPISILFDPDNSINIDHWRRDRVVISDSIRQVDIMKLGLRSIEEIQLIMNGCLIGGSNLGSNDELPKLAETFSNHATHILTPGFSDPYIQVLTDPRYERELGSAMRRIISERVFEEAGLLRFIVGVMALINSKEYVTRETIKPTDRKPAPESNSNKRSPIYDFIDYTAPHKVFVRDIIESQTVAIKPKQSRPQHEVMGHFAHSRIVGDDACQHEYEKRGMTNWICLSCGKTRWFRREHIRGNADVGIVDRKSRVVVS